MNKRLGSAAAAAASLTTFDVWVEKQGKTTSNSDGSEGTRLRKKTKKNTLTLEK